MSSQKQVFVLFPWLLVAYGVTLYMSMDAYMPALPHIAQVLGISPNTAQWTATVWMLGGLTMQPILGPVSDHVGRRPVLLFGIMIFVLASFACAMVTQIQWLLVFRYFQGMGLPAMFIGGIASVNEYFESQQSIKIMAKMNAITITAPAIGPLFGSLILLMLSWHWIFIILGCSAFICLVALYFKMPETHAVEHRPTTFSLKQILVDYGRVVSNPAFMLGACVAFLSAVGLIAWLLAGPFIVIRQFHYPNYVFGLIQLVVFTSYMMASRVVSRFAESHNNRQFVIVGLVLMTFGASLAEGMAYLFPHHLWWTVGGVVLLMFGNGLVMPIMSRLTLESSDVSMGVRTSVLMMTRTLTGIMASLSVSFLYDGTLASMTRIMLVFILITAGLFLLSQVIKRWRII